MGRMRKKYRNRHHAWLVRALIRRDGDVCSLCGHAIARREMTIDHVVAKSRGGGESLENLQLAHGPCNKAKGVLSQEEWAELQGEDEERWAA